MKTYFFSFQKLGPNLLKTFFFCSSANFGQKLGPNLSEDLFFFALHLILGKKLEPNLSEDLFFARRLILGARHRSSYPLEKSLSEALSTGIESAGLLLSSATHP